MRNIITLIFFLTSNILLAQSDVLVVYIDISSTGGVIPEIKKQVKTLVNDNEDSEILIFISNGTDDSEATPFITVHRADVSKTLDKLNDMSGVAFPDINKDIVRLNKELINNNYISNISDITVNSALAKSLEFHFYFDKNDYKAHKLEQKMLLPILFANHLKFKDSLQANCRVWTQLGTNENPYTDEEEKDLESEERFVAKNQE